MPTLFCLALLTFSRLLSGGDETACTYVFDGRGNVLGMLCVPGYDGVVHCDRVSSPQLGVSVLTCRPEV